MISGSSWYSSAETHIYVDERCQRDFFTNRRTLLVEPTFLKVPSPAKMDPPIQVEY